MPDGLPLPESSVNASLPLAQLIGPRNEGDAEEVAGWEWKRECEKGRACMKLEVRDEGAEARWWTGG